MTVYNIACCKLKSVSNNIDFHVWVLYPALLNYSFTQNVAFQDIFLIYSLYYYLIGSKPFLLQHMKDTVFDILACKSILIVHDNWIKYYCVK